MTQVTQADRAERHLQDHARMLWRDDVEGICETPDLCFEYGRTVRCSPCAIKQSDAAGVRSLNRDQPYLPEMCRLNRAVAERDARIAELEAKLAKAREALEAIRSCTTKHGGAAEALRIITAALKEIDNAQDRG